METKGLPPDAQADINDAINTFLRKTGRFDVVWGTVEIGGGRLGPGGS